MTNIKHAWSTDSRGVLHHTNCCQAIFSVKAHIFATALSLQPRPDSKVYILGRRAWPFLMQGSREFHICMRTILRLWWPQKLFTSNISSWLKGGGSYATLYGFRPPSLYGPNIPSPTVKSDPKLAFISPFTLLEKKAQNWPVVLLIIIPAITKV